MKLPTTTAFLVVTLGGALLLGGSHLVMRLSLPNPRPDSTALTPHSVIREAAPVTAPLKPVVTVTQDGPYIVVRNTGAPATFRAHLLVTHVQQFPSVSAGSRFEAIWEATLSDRSEIVTGDADRLLVGPVAGDHDEKVAYFHFYDVATQKMGVREARQVSDGRAPVLSIDLTLVSLPALAGGPKTYDFVLFPGRVEFLTEKPD